MSNEIELEQKTTNQNSDSELADLLESRAVEIEQSEKIAVESEVQQEEKAAEKAVKTKIDVAMEVAVPSVMMLCAAVEKKWPVIKIEDSAKLDVSRKAAAVLAKYDCQLPPWLMAYKEELELGLALGMMAYGGYLAVQAQKKIEAEKAEGGENGEEPLQRTPQ